MTGCGNINNNSADVSTTIDTSETTTAEEQTSISLTAGIRHNDNFNGIDIKIGYDAMILSGFTFGDSVDITLSNGKSYTGIPYYDGYHCRSGELAFVLYPGYEYPHFTCNGGADIWETDGLSDDLTATVTLNEKGKYLSIENALSLTYQNNRGAYETDEEFANFRAVSCGDLHENCLYRSASPCNNEYNRASYVDSLLGSAGVNYILNLADNDDEIAGYMAEDDFDSPNFLELYNTGRVGTIDLTFSFKDPEYAKLIVDGLREMIQYDPPYLFHCTEGKDRTGLLAIILEALCGASYEEMKQDYMETYENYYGVTEERNPGTYAAIVEIKFNDLIDYLITLANDNLSDSVSYDEVNFKACAIYYLLQGGMTEDELNTLCSRLCTVYGG